MTIRERLCAGLEAIDAKRVPDRDTGKYIAYYRGEVCRTTGKRIYFFVGKSGALRGGTCGSQTWNRESSVATILAYGDKAIASEDGKLNKTNTFVGM